MDKLKRGETAQFFALLRQHIGAEKPDFGNGDSPLSLLYEVYNELNGMDSEQIRADFEALYQAMHGMTLKEMDAVINPVCSLCRHHECAGFIEGVKVGMRIPLSKQYKPIRMQNLSSTATGASNIPARYSSVSYKHTE